MPFISRLKQLGVLPVPELETTLTVYLINLEHSEETNLVYTSSNPIPPDASPPASLYFESPDARSKRGDVLLWAKRVRKKACLVHACWVFDGQAWTKPSSDSEVMMDHPEHSDYQLVILSGPYVKWELKPDPDREPSLTIPDPPPVRLGARGSMNAILTSSPTPARTAAEQKASESHRPQDHSTVSGTPDGSAVLCSSSRFSTPLSDAAGHDKTEPTTRHDSCTPLAKLPKFHRASSSDPAAKEAQARQNINSLESAVSPPMDTDSYLKRVNKRPRGARPLPRGRQATPVPGAPPTPESSKLTRSRAARHPPASAPPSTPRPLKRHRSGEDDVITSPPSPPRDATPKPVDSLPPAAKKQKVDESKFLPRHFHIEAPTTAPNVSPPRDTTSQPAESLPPATKKQKMDEGDDPQLQLVIKLPIPVPGAASNEMEVHDEDGEYEYDDEDASEGTVGLWEMLDGVQRDKDKLEAQVKKAAEIATSHSRLAKEVREKDGIIEELRREIAVMQEHTSDAPRPESKDKTAPEVPNTPRPGSEATQDALKDQQFKDETPRDETHLFSRIQQLEHDMAKAKKAAESQLAQLRNERDSAREEAEASRAQLQTAIDEAQQARRNAGDLADARARDAVELSEARLAVRTLETSLNNNDTEQTRRAASFEASLRVAQEALQRQRSHAQETEARQQSTIAQLARELQEKDQNARGLAEQVEGEKRRIGEMKKALDAATAGLAEERDSLARTKHEIERIKHATQEDRQQITRLTSERAADQEELSQSRALAEQLRQDCTARDAAIAKEVQSRLVLEARVLELQKLVIAMDQVRKAAEENLAMGRAATHGLESQLKLHQERFDEHLVVADKERGRLEELLLERRSSLQLDLKSKARDLESAQAECAKLKAERCAERDRLNGEIAGYRENFERALEEQMQLRTQVSKAEQSLEDAQVDCAMTKSILSQERESFTKQLPAIRAELQKELSESQEALAQSVKERERIDSERAALQLESRTQAQDLEAARKECLQWKTDLSSAREHHVSELSSTKSRLEQAVMDIREELKTTEQTFQVQRVSLELKACRAAEGLKTSQTEASKLNALIRILRAESERSATELSSAHDEVVSLNERLTTAEKLRAEAERLSAEERASFEDDSKSNRRELEEARSNFASATTQLALEHQHAQDLRKTHAELEKELSACQSRLVAAEEKRQRLEDEQTTLRLQSSSTSGTLEVLQGECSRLKAELSSERERFRVERSMSPDAMRAKLSSVEACLEHERTTTRTLREELAKEQSSNYWSELGSQLLRSLHDAQDQLKDEQVARQALELQLELRRANCPDPEPFEPSLPAAQHSEKGVPA